MECSSFFSYTETEDEVSLIMREDLFPLFEKISVSDCKPLLAIKLDIPIGFEFGKFYYSHQKKKKIDFI